LIKIEIFLQSYCFLNMELEFRISNAELHHLLEEVCFYRKKDLQNIIIYISIFYKHIIVIVLEF